MPFSNLQAILPRKVIFTFREYRRINLTGWPSKPVFNKSFIIRVLKKICLEGCTIIHRTFQRSCLYFAKNQWNTIAVFGRPPEFLVHLRLCDWRFVDSSLTFRMTPNNPSQKQDLPNSNALYDSKKISMAGFPFLP